MLLFVSSSPSTNNVFKKSMKILWLALCVSTIINRKIVVVCESDELRTSSSFLRSSSTALSSSSSSRDLKEKNGEKSPQNSEKKEYFQNPPQPLLSRSGNGYGSPSTATTTTTTGQTSHETLLELADRMIPHEFLYAYNATSNRTTGIPNQFMHLHHMKSGGTSLSSYIRCAISRTSANGPRKYANASVTPPSDFQPRAVSLRTYSLSECSFSSFNQCMASDTSSCHRYAASASTATYCAPLFASNKLQWDNSRAVTMIRDPVARVWSMFRFSTRGCYHCQTLKEVYANIDSGNITQYGGICAPQITNHITRNLMSLDMTDDTTEEEKLADALHNLYHRFSVVGILEKLDESLHLMSQVFPWMNQTVHYSNIQCSFPHSNSSPSNNHCGPNGSHWDLPEKPDEESKKLIINHNQLDIQLYQHAMNLFEMQKEALVLAQDLE